MSKVPIENIKCMEKIKYDSKAPMPKYCKNALESCCCIIFVSAFHSNNQTKATNAIVIHK